MDKKNNIPMRDEYARLPLIETTDDNVKVTFYFKPDECKMICDTYGDEVIDCFEDYLGLKRSLDTNINIIGLDGTILECDAQTGYQTLFAIWFKERARLYGIRIDREIVATKLKINLLRNTIRFVEECNKYALNQRPIEEIQDILASKKFDRYVHAAIENPKYSTIDEMRAFENGPDANYDYLIDLSTRQMANKACDARAASLKRELTRLAELEADIKGQFKGANTWLRELDALEKTIRLGLQKGWDYGKPQPKFKE
jgi:hypothetical protein